MSQVALLQDLARIADTPGALPALRRFVLNLAVRGKLVEQNPQDEPAPKLLERILSEKAQLPDATRTKRGRPLGLAEDPPYKIPSSWIWVPLGETVLNHLGGGTPSKNNPDYWGGKIYWASVKDVGHGKYIDGTIDRITEAGLKNSSSNLIPPNTLIVVTRMGLGKVSINRIPIAINQDLRALSFSDLLDINYCYIYFKTFEFEGTGLTVKGIKVEELLSIPFPLPPLPEQRRIATKVDELLELCSRLKEAWVERESRRDRLVAASTRRLEHAGNAQGPPPEFYENVRFHLQHLPRFTSRANQIPELRNTILSLAMRGLVVPQDSRDLPASQLLAQKVELPEGHQRRRKILKKTSLGMAQDMFPPIPESWMYKGIQTLYDLNAIVDYADGNHGSLYPRKNEFGEAGVAFVTAKDLANGRVMWGSCAKLKEQRARQLKKGWAKGGDVLLTHNATVGRVAQVEPEVGRFLLGTSVTFYRLNPDVIAPRFFFYVLNSPLWQQQLQAIMAQTTRNQVSIQKQALFRVVIPPLPEQHRIVAKVEELLAICDKLEVNLNEVGAHRLRLLDAVVHEALALAS